MNKYLIALRVAGTWWVGNGHLSSSAHPDFVGLETRTKTEIDNLILFSDQNLVASGASAYQNCVNSM